MLALANPQTLSCMPLISKAGGGCLGMCAYFMLPRAYRTFWQIFAWSLQCMATGVWPAKNVHGTPYAADSPGGKLAGSALAGGWRALLCAMIGDLEFHDVGYELQNPNSGGMGNSSGQGQRC